MMILEVSLPEGFSGDDSTRICATSRSSRSSSSPSGRSTRSHSKQSPFLLAVRQIFHLPDPVSEAAGGGSYAEEWERVERVADDLVETMHGFPRCVGLAAPQIGESVRIVVVDVSPPPQGRSGRSRDTARQPPHRVHDRIRRRTRGFSERPDFTADVRRATEVVVEGLTRSGEAQTVEASGFEAARCSTRSITWTGCSFSTGSSRSRATSSGARLR